MQILRQKRNEQGEWVDFIDQMTPEEEQEFYQREITALNEKMKPLFQDMKGLEELIANGFEAEGDAEKAQQLRTALEQMAIERKNLISLLQ